ncbi:hypothetical protein [Nocardia pneumoniae]|uniref:hypothetical protein n=1 Tax=Nocardia pneumoniae TaxID=228601 RepID=UPI00031BE9CF|nr:hypothetical protein [Nocardia pneumoniae]
MNMRTVIGFALVLAFPALALEAPFAAAQSGKPMATWNVEARNVGGRVAGQLFADGTAEGTGRLAVPMPGGAATYSIKAVSWTAVSPTDYGIIVEVDGGAAGVRCLVVPVTTGEPQFGVGIANDGNCAHAEPQSDVAGRVTLLP